jgi:hypothetical protein
MHTAWSAEQFRLHCLEIRVYPAIMKATMTLASIALSVDNAVSASSTILVSDAIEVTGDTAIYTYGDGGTKTQIRFPIATDRTDPVLYHDVQRVGESAGVVAVLDTYGSKNGGERCANGRESWVRLFSIVHERLTASIPVESCLDRRESSEPPVTWQGNGFTINGREPRKFKIVNGKAQSDEERR